MTEAEGRSEVGVFTTNDALVIHSWDIWMARASGIAEEDARGRSLLELFPDIETRGLVTRLRNVLEHGTVDILAPAFHHYLVKCPTSAGGTYYDAMQQHVTLSPLREHGKITGLIVTIEDVTARCVRERDLSQQLKSSDEAIRLRATQELSREKTGGAPLVQALGDSSWQVRRVAAAGIAGQGSTDAITRLVDIVRDRHTDLATLNAALSALTLAKSDSLPQLVTLLTSRDPNVRMYTALTLGNMQDARALPALIPLIKDDDLNVQYHVIEALGRIRSATAVEPLLEVVRQRDAFLSFAALDALASIGEPSTMPDVIALIDDPSLGSAAIDTLAVVGNEQAAGPLAAALISTPVPTAVCNALAQIHDRLEREYGEGELVADIARSRIDAGAASKIVASIPNASDAELPGVARVLGWLRYPGLEATLGSLLKHAPSRRNAQEALVNFGQRAVPGLLGELKHPEPEVRQAAAAVLGRIGGRESVAALTELLSNEQPSVMVIVAAALGSIGSPEAFESLVPLLGHSDAAVRHAAISAINSIAHPATASRMSTLLASHNSLIRESAVRVAGYFGFAACFDQMLQLLNDESPHVRRAVVEHLPYFEDARSTAALARALRDNDTGVRAAVGRALGHLSATQADSLLEGPLSDVDPRVRYQAAQAVGTHKLQRFAPKLRALLADDSAMPVRIASAIALGELQDAAAADILKATAIHPETDLACPAIIALSRLPRVDAREVVETALSSANPRRQMAGIEAAARLNSFMPQLVRAAQTADDPRVAAAALNALVASGEPEAIAYVVDMSAREDRRTEVTNALAGVSPAEVAIVARGLRHDDPRVRWAVVQALGRMRDGSASRELGVALQDKDPAVRFAAAQALGRFDMLSDRLSPDATTYGTH
jgi:HEAT repeat protein